MIQNFNKTHNTNYPYQHPHIQHARANLDNNNNRKYNNNNWQGQHHYKINHKINHNKLKHYIQEYHSESIDRIKNLCS